MNPWQHPIFDENIHCLLALLSSLCRGCGGVVYLMAADAQAVTLEIFQIYQERLHALIGSEAETLFTDKHGSDIFAIRHTQIMDCTCSEKSSFTLKHTPVETGGIWKPITLEFDLFGQIYAKPESDSQNDESYRDIGRSKVPLIERAASSALSTYSQENNPLQTRPETSSESGITALTASGHSDDTAYPKVNFSSCQRLDWAENTKDRQKYIKTKEVKTDGIIGSCPMWNPTQPMTITSDRESIRYLFESEKNMEETLLQVTTKEPGYAIVCQTWRVHILDDDAIEYLPPGHICNILTVTDTGMLTFWVVVNIRDLSNFENHLEYMMTTGRMLKFQIVKKAAGDFSNLWIDCRMRPLTIPNKLRVQECQEIQRHLHHTCYEGIEFVFLQQAVAKLILSKKISL